VVDVVPIPKDTLGPSEEPSGFCIFSAVSYSLDDPEVVPWTVRRHEMANSQVAGGCDE